MQQQGLLGKRLRLIRAQRKLSLRQAAKLAGLAKETLGDLERGKRHPTDITLAKLAEIYEISLQELFDLEEEDSAREPSEAEPEESAELPKASAPVSQGSALESGGAGDLHIRVSDPKLFRAALERGTSFSKMREDVERYCQEWEESLAEEPTPKMRERNITFAAGAHTTAGRDAFISAAAVILPALMVAQDAEALTLALESGLSKDELANPEELLERSEIFAASRRYTRLLEAIMDAEIKAQEDHEAEREAIRRRQEVREWSRRLGVA